jgi:hypothetical protein
VFFRGVKPGFKVCNACFIFAAHHPNLFPQRFQFTALIGLCMRRGTEQQHASQWQVP